jgi:hypothetical protein
MTYWIVVAGCAVVCFAEKYIGHLIPERWLANAHVHRINDLMPLVLLSALVAVQAFTIKTHVLIDQRVTGLIVAAIALKYKAPFFVVVLLAAAASALTYHVRH